MNKRNESGAVSEEDFEIAFDETPIIEVSSVKELRDVMGSITHKLNSDDWQVRVVNLRQIRSVFKGNSVGVEDYLQNLKYMDMELKGCVSDLRSQVVREACITVAYLSKEMKSKLDSLVEQILENLLNLVPNGAKVMSSSGKIALKIIVYNVQSVRILQFILTSITGSKSTAVRQFAGELLKLICENWPIKCLEKNAANIAETLKSGLNDADEQARAKSREAFCWFNDKFPSHGDKLVQNLDSNKQKMLQRELSLFANNHVTDAADDSTKIPKGSIPRPINTAKNFGARDRINSAKADYHSTNNSNEYLYVKPQSTAGFRAAKQKIPIMQIDSGRDRGRTTKISQSQPASRDASPSSKSGYITYTNGNTADVTQFNSFTRHPTNGGYNSLRYKEIDADIRNKGLRIKRNGSDYYQSDDNASETSSIISDHLPSYSEIIVLLNSKVWSDRKRGLNKAERYICECTLKPSERLTLMELFSSMFLESQASVIKKLLVVLHLFINRYHDHINDWLYPLMGNLFTIHSNERMKNCKPDVCKVQKSTIDCFGTAVVFAHCCKYLIDKNQELSIKLKMSALEYMKMVLTLAQPSLLDGPRSLLGPALGNLIVMTTDSKSTDLRKLASSLVIKLFDLNSSQFTLLLQTIPKTFQDRATTILDAHVAANNTTKEVNKSSDMTDTRTSRQKTDPNRTSDFIKSHTEALQNMSQNCDNFERSSVVSNSSNRSVTSPNYLGTYQRTANHNAHPQTKHSQTATTKAITNNNKQQRLDDQNVQRYLATQNSQPDLGTEASSNQSPGLYPATSNDSNVDNKYNPEYYNSGPINASTLSKGDASSSNAELPPEDVMYEILKELSNHNDRHEQRKACLFKLIKIFRINTPIDWVEHFQMLLFLLLETMGDNDADIRAQSLRVLQELIKGQSARLDNYCQLTILRVLEAHNDCDKSVVKAAEECSRVLTTTIPRHLCYKQLTDIISEGNDSTLCFAALKMVSMLIKTTNRETLDANLDKLSLAFSTVLNHSDSKVRKESVLCLVEIHKVIGAELFSRMTLSNAQKRLVEVYITKCQAQS